MAGQLHGTQFRISSRGAGFTIVELLIVIVVIGILAALTIVAFNGVSNKAKVALVSSDLTSVSKKLKIDQTINGAYPLTLAATDSGKGVPASAGTTYQYTVDNTVNPQTFCVTAVNGSVAYFITQSGVATSGTCPGDSATGVVAPVIGGYVDLTNDVPMTNIPLPAIPDGAWMMIVISYTNSVDAVPPTGWTTLYSRITANTMQTMVFGEIKTSSEPSTFSIGGTIGYANGAIFWGTGASNNLNTWIKGASANRNNTTAQQYVTITPTLTTVSAQNLIISISTERTSIIESDISSFVGANRWFYIPQPDGNRMQTIFVSTATLASPGVSTPVTVTYPNPQLLNGTALQVALPPT
ncbi:MAG TPA: type II secretion system protein [Candidatus Microsaccharimonas sp.]|jgi:general secretion pathway protein G